MINPNAAQVLMRVKNGAANYYVYGLGLLYEVDSAELNGGSLRIIAQGENQEMLRLERQLHETL